MKCIFCKIINKEIKSDIVYENKKVISFKDAHPQSPIHLLIVPKKHISSVASDNSENIIKDLIVASKKITKEKNITDYKLLFNVGRKAGQTVDHLHMHLLAN